jgi:hypothetical protein
VHLVADAIGQLPDREKLVISLYYNEDLTMKEVGGVLGLTESRVSQLHSQAMLRLKRYLATKLASVEPAKWISGPRARQPRSRPGRPVTPWTGPDRRRDVPTGARSPG